jgi:hypothetical protein
MPNQEDSVSQIPGESQPAHTESPAPQRRAWTPPVVEEIHYSRTESTISGIGSDGPFSYS